MTLFHFFKTSSVTSWSAPTKTPTRTPSPTLSTHTSMNAEDIDYHSCHRILSALADNLYDKLWVQESQITMRGTRERIWPRCWKPNGSPPLAFNKFMIVDSKPINKHMHKFQDYTSHLQSKGNQFSDDHKVSCLIDKLPRPSQTLLEIFVTREPNFDSPLRRFILKTSVGSTPKPSLKWRPKWTW